MVTVAQIAKEAMDGVAAEITDAIYPASLSEDTQGAFNAVTGVFAITVVTAQGRAVVDTVTPTGDIFPAYVAGPGDELILLAGFSAARENMRLTFGGWVRHVTAVQDILNAQSLFFVIARKVTLGPNESPTLGPNFDGNEW